MAQKEPAQLAGGGGCFGSADAVLLPEDHEVLQALQLIRETIAAGAGGSRSAARTPSLRTAAAALTDAELVRFIQARRYDVEKATDMQVGLLM